MVASALEALVGGEPAGEAVESALATIPVGELDAALRWLVREHGAAALPILRHCLADRPDRAIAAAHALGTLPLPEAAQALEATEGRAATKPVRTAARRALYRLRQAGVDRPAAVSSPAPRRIGLGDAWASAIDGTGGRGLWLTLAGPYGERTLLAAVLSDELGLLDFSTGAMPKKRIDEQLRSVQAESPLPWVAVPPDWAWATLVAAVERTRAADRPVPPELEAWIKRLGAPASEPAPVYARLPAEAAAEPALLESSATLLALPELAGWFLDPESVQSDAVDLLQARESKIVVSDQIKAEREDAIITGVVERELTGAARPRWARRLAEMAFVFRATERLEPAAVAEAAAAALADEERAVTHQPFARALAQRGLDFASEVALGRIPAAEVSRKPGA